ncbi:general odorant-binding protein 19d-like [Leguminivora glycinivorella]|uniref:general odorant-binding protein 19d-like n=1 Tax=Leguminivora glycinivorella TaxID=1035111 RepID=UPI00200E3ACA|nr:general odorant-binding protein 19d-like [Leguminivora glycinivorella]
MAKMSVFICSLYVLVLTSYSMAMTEEQKNIIKQHFHEMGAKCIGEHQISEEDITTLKNKGVPTGPNAPCFLACVLKSSGIMDNSGMLQKETMLEMAKSVFNDPEELAQIEKYLHSCSHINGEAVSDGDKGCERAVLAHKCMLTNAAQFGFDI